MAFFPPQGQRAQAPVAVLTPGTLTVVGAGEVRQAWSTFAWTNAMVIAAAGTSNKITVCTLPAKTLVHRVLVVIDTAATQAATLTVQAGTAADTDGYVVASNAKATANTVYGDADAEIGVLLFPVAADDHPRDDLPSYTATTAIQIEFVIGAGTLADALTSTGRVLMLTSALP